MPEQARIWVAPVYLFACLVLGGAGGASWQDMGLQLGGVAILAWVAGGRAEPLGREATIPLIIVAAGIAVVAIQVLPLSWLIPSNGVRARIAGDLGMLGLPTPVTLSLSPYGSLATLLGVIPPLAMFSLVSRSTGSRSNYLVAALFAGTSAVMLLSAVAGWRSPPSDLYTDTAGHVRLNVSANADHIAALLLVALAFGVAAGRTGRGAQSRRVMLIIGTLFAGLMMVGLALTRSVAAYCLVGPVLAASFLTWTRGGTRPRKLIVALGALSLAVALLVLSSSKTSGTVAGSNPSGPLESRREILTTTGAAISDFMPLGSGLGSFPRIYPLYERVDAVRSRPIRHAYNDYAELALELGLPGVSLVLAFLAWWGTRVWRLRPGSRADPFRLAAAIGSATLLVDSLFNYPLRTSSLSVVLAMCLGLLASSEARRTRDGGDLRPTRHVVIA